MTYNDTGLFLGKSLSFQKHGCFLSTLSLQEAQQALVAADGLSRDSGDGASTPQGVEPAEPQPSVEAVPGEVKEDTEKPEGPELTVDP